LGANPTEPGVFSVDNSDFIVPAEPAPLDLC
jgi:hypothetical protein